MEPSESLFVRRRVHSCKSCSRAPTACEYKGPHSCALTVAGFSCSRSLLYTYSNCSSAISLAASVCPHSSLGLAGPDAKKWEYVDLQGKEHGLFTSKQMVGWADRVFPPDLQVLAFPSTACALYTCVSTAG